MRQLDFVAKKRSLIYAVLFYALFIIEAWKKKDKHMSGLFPLSVVPPFPSPQVPNIIPKCADQH